MPKKLILSGLFIILFLFPYTGYASGEKIINHVLGTGGSSTSENFIVHQTIGETATGKISSDNLKGGFWHAVAMYSYTIDSDGDGLPDSWEIKYFGNLAQDPADDPDSDQLTNLEEYILGVNPNDGISDTDGDSLVDRWEIDNFGSLATTPGDDPDGDFLTNLEEHMLGTDPNETVSDTDGDGIKDRWELDNFGGLSQNNDDDPDADGIANYMEYKFGTDPNDISDRPAAGIIYKYDALGRIKNIIRIPSN